MNKIFDRLVSIKSIVTLVLTGVFAYLVVTGSEINETFLHIYTTAIAFYFGTQAEKRTREVESNAEQSEP
jgi:5-bromo-4-chloroindolyl phosphate hydrolysis protein